MFLFPTPSADSPPMFDSRFIDRFSRTHWSIVPLLFVPAVTIMLGLSVVYAEVPVWLTGGLALAGLLAWTFNEYWLHRTLFHWIPNDTWGARMHFLLHGVHHDWPRDKYRLVMPPAVSISLFCLFLGLWTVVFGRYVWAFHAGFVAGYLYYDCIHYYVHHASCKSRWTKLLRKHHLAHHSPKLADNAKFGVSTTLWDHVFRTY